MDLLLLPLLCSNWYPWKSPWEKFSSDNLSNLLLNKFLVLLSLCTLGCVATWTWLPLWRSWLPWKWSTTMSLSESPPWSWLREFPTSTPESPLLGEVTMEVRWFPRKSRAEVEVAVVTVSVLLVGFFNWILIFVFVMLSLLILEVTYLYNWNYTFSLLIDLT